MIYQEVGEDGELDLFEFYFLLFSHVIPWWYAIEQGDNWKDNSQRERQKWHSVIHKMTNITSNVKLTVHIKLLAYATQN